MADLKPRHYPSPSDVSNPKRMETIMRTVYDQLYDLQARVRYLEKQLTETQLKLRQS